MTTCHTVYKEYAFTLAMYRLKFGIWELFLRSYKLDKESVFFLPHPHILPRLCSCLLRATSMCGPGAWRAAAAVSAEKDPFYFLRRATVSRLWHTWVSWMTITLAHSSRVGFLPSKVQAATRTTLLPSLLVKWFSHSSKSLANNNSSMNTFLGLSSGLPFPLSLCL